MRNLLNKNLGFIKGIFWCEIFIKPLYENHEFHKSFIKSTL